MDKKQRAKLQKYPSWQGKIEEYQLKLNHAAVMSNMKLVGKYSTLIDKIWERYHQK